MSEPKRIYMAATARNEGKTTISVGLIGNLRDRLEGVGFIKPVGQRYQVVDGAQVDEDSVLVARVWSVNGTLKAMSPVAIDRHFKPNLRAVLELPISSPQLRVDMTGARLGFVVRRDTLLRDS